VIAFRLPAGVPVYAFALLLGFSVTLGLAWVAWQASDEQGAKRRVDACLWVLGGGLLGGRAVEVAYHWAYYQSHPGDIQLVSSGGFAWSGALAGGFLGLLLYARLERKSLGALADALLPLIAAVTIGAWLGCWVDGYAYGQPASGWWGIPARDEWGGVGSRIPVQFIGVLLTLGIYWLADRQRSSIPGWKAVLGVLGGCLELFALSFLRADPAPVWKSLRPEAWAALVLAGCCMLALWMMQKSTG